LKILVLGIGNILYSDEGVGVQFAELLKEKYNFTSQNHTIEFTDGGTLANLLTPLIAKFDHVILIDCISADDGAVGDVYFFDYDIMPKNIAWSGSAHEIEMLQTLQFMELSGDLPKVKILGVVPKRIEPMSFELSSEMQKAAAVMEKTVLEHFSSLGITAQIRRNLKICDISKRLKEAKYDCGI